MPQTALPQAGPSQKSQSQADGYPLYRFYLSSSPPQLFFSTRQASRSTEKSGRRTSKPSWGVDEVPPEDTQTEKKINAAFDIFFAEQDRNATRLRRLWQ